MDNTQRITWFAGLFEGEGTFRFVGGKPKGMAIQMTDLDVLEKVQQHFGGSIGNITKRESHWKDSWIWYLNGEASVELTKEILPFLMTRRAARAREYIDKYVTVKMYRETQRSDKEALIQRVFFLRGTGMTHQQIANEVGKDRTYISHILRKGTE